MALYLLLPSSPRPGPTWDQGRWPPLQHKSAWGAGATFAAERPVMWLLVFISTNAIICCPIELFLLNEKKNTANVCKTSRPGTEKDKVNFFLFPCSLLTRFVVWWPPHPGCYIQPEFLPPCLCVELFETGFLGGLNGLASPVYCYNSCEPTPGYACGFGHKSTALKPMLLVLVFS